MSCARFIYLPSFQVHRLIQALWLVNGVMLTDPDSVEANYLSVVTLTVIKVIFTAVVTAFQVVIPTHSKVVILTVISAVKQVKEMAHPRIEPATSKEPPTHLTPAAIPTTPHIPLFMIQSS